MCPVCIATLASIVAGATSTGSIAALVVSRLHGKENKIKNDQQEPKSKDRYMDKNRERDMVVPKWYRRPSERKPG